MHELIAKSADTVGIIGVILLLVAYYLLNINKMTALNLNYQLLNFFGAVFILFSLIFNWNLASALIETAWVLISLLGIYRAMRAKEESI